MLDSGLESLTNHDGFPFVLKNMAGPTDFSAASKAKEHELIRWIYWFLDHMCHSSSLAF
jgi:hypothetical protein